MNHRADLQKEHFDYLERRLVPGVLYEDCRYHPMVCVGIDKKSDLVLGISLIDGKLGQCSYKYCGVRIMTPAEAFRNRVYGLTAKAVQEDREFRKEWLSKKELRKHLKECQKKKERGIFFPEANPEDVAFLEGSLGKKLRRRW